MKAEDIEAMNQKQTWTCEHCKKTFKDPDGLVRYFHGCPQRKAYWNNRERGQG